ncbi:biotin synthase BioB [Candidatus Nitrosotalea okcheonensis]|uniref:Biotin synthase n=1 Tax=Candidatus Nitrosotalea okcheonensis TaxID=1903276 RepID=A0A2H1FDM4_9ARCH|nr:biotin synthase BioB [Candidatus Nitrosotalea okcheonensis]SMH70864.1 Biotin synthase [Candidatus Nitrosotalea okcheonensis]
MTSETDFIISCKDRVLSGHTISQGEAERLINVSDDSLHTLSDAANEITRKLCGNMVDVEALINAKKGKCQEDCSFCSQSAFFKTGIDTYKLLPPETIVQNAMLAKEDGVKSFCLVCAWRGPTEKDFEQISSIIEKINREVGIEVNCSLGFINEEMAIKLKKLGVKRYNHNLETPRSFFEKICTTHTYDDRMKTNLTVKKVGLELCCGGIIGMGETRMQRLELGLDLAGLEPEECPINMLVPQKGTPLELQTRLSISEILRTIAVFRFLMPKTILKIAGGREVYLINDQERVLLGGANGIITGGYLTIGGNKPTDDFQMISKIGLEA